MGSARRAALMMLCVLGFPACRGEGGASGGGSGARPFGDAGADAGLAVADAGEGGALSPVDGGATADGAPPLTDGGDATDGAPPQTDGGAATDGAPPRTDGGAATDGAPAATDADTPLDAARAELDARAQADAAGDAEGPRDTPDGGQADAAPPVDPARPTSPRRLLDGPIQFAAPLRDGGFVADTPAGLVMVARDGDEPRALGLAAGAVHAAALLDDVLLVAGTEGLFVSGDEGLVRSPLDAHVRGVTALRVLPGPDGAPDLWLATAGGLSLWRDGRLHGVRPGDLPTASAKLTLGPHPRSDAAVWVASGAHVYALVVEDGALVAWPHRVAGAPVEALSVDGSGTSWIAAGGALWRDASTRIPLPIEVLNVAAGPGAPDLWLATDEGLWHGRDDRFHPLVGAPAGTRLAADAAGAVLVAGDDGLFRVFPGRHLALLGLRDGQQLVEPAHVTLEPAEPAAVAEVTFSIDGAPPAALPAPWTLRLDPADLGDGPHALLVAVTWADGERVEARRRFSVRLVGPPTWDDDVGPIFLAHCDACHGPRGYAHRLDGAPLWRAEIDRILAAVRARRMPLAPNPPLDPADVERIDAWRAAGFPESWP